MASKVGRTMFRENNCMSMREEKSRLKQGNRKKSGTRASVR